MWEDSGADDVVIVSSFEREKEQRRLAAEASQKALDAIPPGREKDMVVAIDELLSFKLGGPDGYLSSAGAIHTGQLRRALAGYGITPDYGASIGRPLRLDSQRR